jgi:hypothetical protein
MNISYMTIVSPSLKEIQLVELIKLLHQYIAIFNLATLFYLNICEIRSLLVDFKSGYSKWWMEAIQIYELLV